MEREETQNGGSAFPLSHDAAIDPITDMTGRDVSSGMTLRDYFAAQALAGICTRDYAGTYSATTRAELAYAHADAMLKAREALK